MVKKHSPLKSAVILRQKRRKFWLRTGLISLDSCLLIVVTVLFVRLPYFNIQSVNVQGAEAVSVAEIENIASANLSGSYFYFIPKTNILFYPKQEIAAAVSEAFPRIKNISLGRNQMTALSISVGERVAHALWCLPDNSKCYFIDDSNYIFATAPTYSNTPFIKYYGGVATSTDKSWPIGSLFVSPAPVSDIETFMTALKGIGINAVSVQVDSNGDLELTEAKGQTVLVSASNFDQTLQNIELVLKQRAVAKATTTDFEYIDARFGNKVFFKPRP